MSYFKNEDYESFLENYLDNFLLYIDSVYQATGKLPEPIEDKIDGAITIDIAHEIVDNCKKIVNRDWWGSFNILPVEIDRKVADAYHTALFNVSSRVVSTQLTGGF